MRIIYLLIVFLSFGLLGSCSDDWSQSHDIHGHWRKIERMKGVNIEQRLFIDDQWVENKELGENEGTYTWEIFEEGNKNLSASHEGIVRVILKDFQLVFSPSDQTKDTLIYQYKLGIAGSSLLFSLDGISGFTFARYKEITE